MLINETTKRIKVLAQAIKLADTIEDFNLIEREIKVLESSLGKSDWANKSIPRQLFITYEKNNPRCRNLKRLVRE